jgi:hypothetical protein
MGCLWIYSFVPWESCLWIYSFVPWESCLWIYSFVPWERERGYVIYYGLFVNLLVCSLRERERGYVIYYGLFVNLLVCSLRERERERLRYLLWVVCEFIGLFLERERERRYVMGFSINNWITHVASLQKACKCFCCQLLHFTCLQHVSFTFFAFIPFHVWLLQTNKSFMHLHYWELYDVQSPTCSYLFVIRVFVLSGLM